MTGGGGRGRVTGLRVVLVMPEPPLPFGNASARWWYVLLRGLVERGHWVTAFAGYGRAEDAERARETFPAPEYDLRCHPHGGPGGLRGKWETLRRPYSFLFGPALRNDLSRELARGFDLLHLQQLWSGWLGQAHADRAVIDLHYLFGIDLAEVAPRSPRDRLRGWITRRAERTLIRRYPHVCTLTPRLGECVRRISPRADVHTIPLGMDLSLYPFQETRDDGGRPVLG